MNVFKAYRVVTLCAQLTRNLLAIAKFLDVVSTVCKPNVRLRSRSLFPFTTAINHTVRDSKALGLASLAICLIDHARRRLVLCPQPLGLCLRSHVQWTGRVNVLPCPSWLCPISDIFL